MKSKEAPTAQNELHNGWSDHGLITPTPETTPSAQFLHYFQNYLGKKTFISLPENYWWSLVSDNLLDLGRDLARVRRTWSLRTKSPQPDRGGKETAKKGSFSLLGPLKLYKCYS